MLDKESEEAWEKAKKDRGWELPPKANWFLRLPVIRNIRAFILAIKIENHYTNGIGQIGIRTGYDEWVLYAIVTGRC